MNPRAILLCCALALGVPTAALAQAGGPSVVLSGVLGSKALLVIDGAAPRSVAVGQTHQGVTVIATQGAQAVVEIAGVRQTLRLGQGPMRADTVADESGNRKIILHAGSNGHFRTPGQINGRAVTFLVDTGASLVSLSVAAAEAAGLRYQNGQRMVVSTANGQSVGWRVKLANVRLGSVDVYDVDALVTPAPMPHVLLGNSYLTRFQMTRTNDQLVLEKRY